MDDSPDDFSDLEAELKALQPMRPREALHRRLEAELGSRDAYSSRWRWWLLPAAAACALGFFLREKTFPTVAASGNVATFQPVTAENVLYAANDEGYVTLDDGTPARRVRASYIDTITWKNPRNNASLQWSVPREEVRIVPVNFQ